MSINIIPFFSSVSPEGLSDQVLNEIRQGGVKIFSNDKEIPSDESLYIFIGTGGTENDVAKFIETTNNVHKVTILSYDERNSLPASMEIRAYLEKKGIPAKIVHKPLAQLHELLGRWSKYSQIIHHLKGRKLGLVGEPSSWLIASGVNREMVVKKWGLEITDIPIQKLTSNLPEELEKGFKSRIDGFRTQAQCQNISDDEISKAGIVAQRLVDIVGESELAAVTVQCFTLLQETGISGCFALSYLNDVQDLVAGCEGDVPSTFSMLLGKMLTGSSSFMANVASVDVDLNTAVFAHCTVPLSIAEGYEITTHFETGRSLGVRGKLPLTEVTIFKVFGEDLSEYWVSSGTIIDNLVNDRGCRTQIRVALDEPVDYFLEQSLANHHIIIPGDHAQEIVEFFDFVNI